MSLVLRYMRSPDIPAVAAIDQMSFNPPWSARSYQFEVTESTYSHMVVLEYGAEKPAPAWHRFVPGLNGSNIEQEIAGYGGMWHIMDEAHISTIATHPDHRGRGWGEVLLAGMIRRAIHLNAVQVVLEVRVSNFTAQNLYKKYAFQTVTTKKNYYHNNNEDAYEMHLNLDHRYYRAHFEERFAKLVARHELVDHFTETAPPQKQKRSS